MASAPVQGTERRRGVEARVWISRVGLNPSGRGTASFSPMTDSSLAADRLALLEHRAWVRALASRDDRVEYVVVRRADQRPVGTAGLASLSRLHRRAEFGILIGEPAPGAAEDAGRTLLRQAFGPLGLDRVYLQTFADNVRALRLFLRLGFREEGLLRRHAAAGGGRRDVRIMGLLRSEADGLPPTA